MSATTRSVGRLLRPLRRSHCQSWRPLSTSIIRRNLNDSDRFRAPSPSEQAQEYADQLKHRSNIVRFLLLGIAGGGSLALYSWIKGDELYPEENPAFMEAIGKKLKPVNNNKYSVSQIHYSQAGAWAWGDNSGHVISDSLGPAVKHPVEIDFLMGQKLRDIFLTPSVGIAVLENGDVLEWGDGYHVYENKKRLNTDEDEYNLRPAGPKVILAGLDIRQAKVANGAIYCLDGKGRLFLTGVAHKDQSSIPVGEAVGFNKQGWTVTKSDIPKGKRTWRTLWLFNEQDDFFPADPAAYATLNQLNQPITKFSVGADHVALLANGGKPHARVYTLAAGINPNKNSDGQFGDWEYVVDAPSAGQLVSVDLSAVERSEYDNSALYQEDPLVDVCSGLQHTLIRTKNGKVFGFGRNRFGQLGVDYTLEKALYPEPQPIPALRGIYVQDIGAGGDRSLFKIRGTTDRKNPNEKDSPIDLVSCGRGLDGELGNGNFVHSTGQLIRLSPPIFPSSLSQESIDRKSVSESGVLERPLQQGRVSLGATHDLMCLLMPTYFPAGTGSTAESKHSLVIVGWGKNDKGQLGNQRARVSKPQVIAETVHETWQPTVDNTRVYAGEGISALYSVF